MFPTIIGYWQDLKLDVWLGSFWVIFFYTELWNLLRLCWILQQYNVLYRFLICIVQVTIDLLLEWI